MTLSPEIVATLAVVGIEIPTPTDHLPPLAQPGEEWMVVDEDGEFVGWAEANRG